MEELTGMGFSHDLAAKALAATGGNSTLTATEWILGHMDSKNPALHRQQQQQGRVDSFFTTISSRRGASYPAAGSSSLGGPMEDASNAHWHSRRSTIASPADVAPQYERKKAVVPAPTGKAQEEDLGLSMFSRRGGGGAPSGSQGGQDYPGLKPRPIGKPWTSDSSNEAPASSSKITLKHAHPSVQEPSSNKRQRQGEPNEVQQEMPVPLFPRSQSAPPQAKGAAASKKSLAPLAERMRPGSVDLIVGQDHLLGPRCILRSLLDNKSISSIIFWGPPGTGKTSLVRAIARSIAFRFIALSAVSSGLKEVREILEEAKRVRKFGERTLLFLDEIHRFNKAQQDAFLPYVEAGHIVFIGATTENPSFEINAALLSRCRVLTLNKLQPEHIRVLLDRAIVEKERGVLLSIAGSSPGDVIKVEEDALQFLAGAADGDARVALNSLELAGLAAFAAWESTPQRPGPDERGAHGARGDAPMKLEAEREVLAEGTVKREPPSSLTPLPPPNHRVERSGSGFGMKRLEVLKENLKKENPPNSSDDYTRPFKRFVGGKEVTPQVPAREVKEAKEALSLSACTTAEAEREGHGGYSHDVAGAREMRDRDGSGPLGAKKSERKGGQQFDGASEPGGSNGVVADMSRRERKTILVTLQQVQEALQRSHVLYDKSGEEHYNVISALHKSMRGGDPDAAIYWLARMLEGGEGPLYVARRLIRFASEDVGMADPQALMLAVACYQACHFIGMPECNVNLAQCVTYLALAPKSVMVYHAIEAAQRLVKGSKQNEPVPLHLRNAPTKLMKDLGYGRAPTDQPVDFLPPSLRGQKFLQWPEDSEP